MSPRAQRSSYKRKRKEKPKKKKKEKRKRKETKISMYKRRDKRDRDRHSFFVARRKLRQCFDESVKTEGRLVLRAEATTDSGSPLFVRFVSLDSFVSFHSPQETSRDGDEITFVQSHGPSCASRIVAASVLPITRRWFRRSVTAVGSWCFASHRSRMCSVGLDLVAK